MTSTRNRLDHHAPEPWRKRRLHHIVLDVGRVFIRFWVQSADSLREENAGDETFQPIRSEEILSSLTSVNRAIPGKGKDKSNTDIVGEAVFFFHRIGFSMKRIVSAVCTYACR